MTPSAELARLEKLIPPEKLADSILQGSRIGAEELQRQGAGAAVELHGSGS